MSKYLFTSNNGKACLILDYTDALFFLTKELKEPFRALSNLNAKPYSSLVLKKGILSLYENKEIVPVYYNRNF